MKFSQFRATLEKPPLSKIKAMIKYLYYWGWQRYCPICQRPARKFGVAGYIARQDASCLHCNSLERHRLVWLYFQQKTDLFNGQSKKMLHVAPEAVFEKLLKARLGSAYLTADLDPTRAMIQMDVTNIQFPAESFDVIYCSHVLEHVPDDRQAMREFFRVLKSDGWAILLVPITAEITFEDPSITDPNDRLKFFGQEDHVRCYGFDYPERLSEAGFQVEIISPADFLTENEIKRMGITEAAGEIYYCVKA
jgi:SAM-dependent methyltransferase